VRRRALLGSAVVCAALLPGGEQAQAGSLDPTLERLRRIAHGSRAWTAPARRGVPYAEEIRRAAKRRGIAPSLLAAVVRAESNFDPRAVSSAGALGLAQLMPRTAVELGVRDPFDPEQNLDAAARYLAEQLDRFDDTPRALAAYHAGPTRAAGSFAWLPAATHTYIARVLRFDLEYRRRGLP
jgi:soluble lytic murein transglycosylase-like protein